MPFSLVKLAVAFLAGLVLALGSALIFVRKDQPRPATAVTEVQQQAPAAEPEPTADAGQAGEPAEPPDDKVAASPESASGKQPTKAPASAKTKFTKRTAPENRGKRSLSPILPPVQIVQNTPPPLPAAPQATYPPLSKPPEDPALASQQPLAGTGPAAPRQPHVVELAAGTNLAIRLGETISTEHNYTDDVFRGTLDEPIIRNGFIIADKGSKVLGRIVNATQAGRMRGVSNLSVTLTEINTTDGQRIKVETNSVEKNGVKSTGTDTAKIAGGAALGAIIGALGGGGKGAAIGAGAGGAAGTGVVLATRGKPAVLPSESRLVFQLASPVTITERLN